MNLLRSLAFNIVMFSAALVFGLAGYAVKPFRPALVIDCGAAWAKFTLRALRAICRIETEITGAQYLPITGPALIAAQHQSAFDTLVWLGLVHHPAYVLKKELLRLPVLGPLLLPSGFVAVDRDGGTPALRKMLTDCRIAAAAGQNPEPAGHPRRHRFRPFLGPQGFPQISRPLAHQNLPAFARRRQPHRHHQRPRTLLLRRGCG
jgi:1-acyl-sn-glycerol-3-phosphate acyltransferase